MLVSLQKAEESDLPAVVSLMNAAFRGRQSGRSWCTEDGYITGSRTTEALLREEIAGGAHFLLARDPQTGALKGCVSLKALPQDTWYLGSLTVDHTLQNAGLGRRVLEAAEAYAESRGARLIEMTVIGIRETLIAWYERRGYARTGEIRPFPYGDDRFGTPLRDDLEFVVLRKRLIQAE